MLLLLQLLLLPLRYVAEIVLPCFDGTVHLQRDLSYDFCGANIDACGQYWSLDKTGRTNGGDETHRRAPRCMQLLFGLLLNVLDSEIASAGSQTPAALQAAPVRTSHPWALY